VKHSKRGVQHIKCLHCQHMYIFSSSPLEHHYTTFKRRPMPVERVVWLACTLSPIFIASYVLISILRCLVCFLRLLIQWHCSYIVMVTSPLYFFFLVLDPFFASLCMHGYSRFEAAHAGPIMDFFKSNYFSNILCSVHLCKTYCHTGSAFTSKFQQHWT